MPKPAKHRLCCYCQADIAALSYSAKMCLPCGDMRRRFQRLALSFVDLAIGLGKIPKPTSLMCEDCGFWAEFYDHRDYNQPLVIVPVCRSCNALRGQARWSATADISTTLKLTATIKPPSW